MATDKILVDCLVEENEMEYCLFCRSTVCPEYPEYGCKENFKEHLINEKLIENFEKGIEQSDEDLSKEVEYFINNFERS